jgi:uncharacterized protein YcnI
MKKTVALLSLLITSLLLFAGIASAHVEVSPNEALQGTFQEFTVRVPNEKDIPTVKIEIDVPSEIDISQLLSAPGWKHDLTKDSSGKITKITWTAVGEGIASSEFQKFTVAGLIAKNASEISWKAHQTYQDGSVVDWTGNETSDTPGPVTKVNPVPKNVIVSDDGDIESSKSPVDSTSNNSNLALYLSIASALLGLTAIFISLRKRSK